MSAAIISLKNVKLKFKNKVIFDNFNFTVNQGEKVLLSAKSGRGKTTLLNILLGFQHIDEGEYLYKGAVVDAALVWQIRREIAYVPQDHDLGSGNISDFLEDIAKLSANKGFKMGNLEKYLQLFELDPLIIHKKIGTLSGGEKQRLAVIVALMLDRKVILMDEPTANLDKELRLKVFDYIKTLKKTVVVVSHNSLWIQDKTFREVIL